MRRRSGHRVPSLRGWPRTRRIPSGIALLIIIVALWQLRKGVPPGEGPTSGEGGGRGTGPEARAPGDAAGFSAGDVARVEDGDTIALADGRKVRYLGIDAPEKDEPLWEAALEANREMVQGRRVELRRGGAESHDVYGRILAVVVSAASGPAREGGEPAGSPREDGVSVGTELVRRGLASVYIKGPESVSPPLLAELLAAQAKALAEEAGIWRHRLPRARSPEEPLVATRFRVHRKSCRELASARPVPVRSIDEELRKGKSFCRVCRPLGEWQGKW